MKIIETCPREIGFVLWGNCQNLLDDPRNFPVIFSFISLKIGFIVLPKTLIIWVSTVCESTCLPVFRIKRVNTK